MTSSFQKHLDHQALRGPLAQRIRSRDYWQECFANIPAALESGSSAPDATTLEAECRRAQQDMRERGYFCTDPVCAGDDVSRALAAFESVEAAGWPPVFAFMSDAIWNLLSSSSFGAVIASVIGEGALQLPGLWAKRVTRESGQGWSPHVDVGGQPKFSPAGNPARLSIWVPLTSSTVDNGCIHVVPENTLPGLSRNFENQSEMPVDDVIRLLHATQALPASPGSILGWRETTLHWGGQSTGRAVEDRVSLALEFGSGEVPLEERERPAFALGTRPDFASRIALIGRSLVVYGAAEDREPLASKFVSLGRELSGEVD